MKVQEMSSLFPHRSSFINNNLFTIIQVACQYSEKLTMGRQNKSVLVKLLTRHNTDLQ